MSSRLDLIERSGQDELLSIRNDLMTVYREISARDPRLFPLRYARATPRRRDTAGRPPWGPGSVAAPQAPLLIIPDGPGTASVLPYDPLRRALSSRGLDVLMMEHRGVGMSRLDATGQDLPREAMRLREVLADLVAVLDHAQVERVAVYGTGYGAYLGQALAALHPERVHSLVLDSPLTSADDERVAQRSLRDAYWDGTDPATSTIAAALRRLAADGVVDAQRAGPVVLAVHDHGGPEAVRDLVDLLVLERGRLTWNSVRQVLTQGWLQSTPYVIEHDLVAPISHTELGRGRHADGRPLDALSLLGERARGEPPFTGEELDLPSLARTITAPTVMLSGQLDLISPPRLARDLAARIPAAHLVEIPGAGHSLLDSRSQVAQIAAWWSACGTAHLLPGFASRLAELPLTPIDRTVTRGLRLALAAERYSPWRLWVESARSKRERAQVDPTARRARKARIG